MWRNWPSCSPCCRPRPRPGCDAAALCTGCDCGAVTVRGPAPPSEINACPCAWCRRIGARWGYFARDAVTVSGTTQVCVRASRRVEFRRCAVCGVTTHRRVVKQLDRTGVNMANADLAGVPVVALA